MAFAEKIKEDHGSRRLSREKLHARCRWMEPQLQRVEIQALRSGNYDLAIQNAMERQLLPEGINQLRKVPIQRLSITTLNENLISIAKNDAAKTVPLGLEYPGTVLWNCLHTFGEHGKHWRFEDEIHC